jgi:hypothetical protein
MPHPIHTKSTHKVHTLQIKWFEKTTHPSPLVYAQSRGINDFEGSRRGKGYAIRVGMGH